MIPCCLPFIYLHPRPDPDQGLRSHPGIASSVCISRSWQWLVLKQYALGIEGAIWKYIYVLQRTLIILWCETKGNSSWALEVCQHASISTPNPRRSLCWPPSLYVQDSRRGDFQGFETGRLINRGLGFISGSLVET
jgi:hypothetical protein